MTAEPAAPVEVLMPAGLLPRLSEPLAAIGMRVYQLPTRNGPTLMIGADLSEIRDQGEPFTTADVLEAWSLAVETLAETAHKAPKSPKTRKRKVSARTPGEATESHACGRTRVGVTHEPHEALGGSQ